VQGLVVVVAGLHYYAEIAETLGYTREYHSLSFVHVSLFFIPLVYAALNFGMLGTIATIVLVAVITAPNIALFHDSLSSRMAETANLTIVCVVALFTGYRVEREMAARRRAESASVALTTSEVRYQGLFESSPAPTLVLDADGIIREVNPASGILFRRTPEKLSGLLLSDLLGQEHAEAVLNRSREDDRGARLIVWHGESSDVYLEPCVTSGMDQQGVPTVQIVFRDVTEEHRRHLGMRAYAVHVQRAQEEERKRVAHQLHDDIVQSLVMIHRELDSAAKRVSEGSPLQVGQMEKCRDEVGGIVAKLRSFAREMRPTVLEDLGLAMAIRGVVSGINDRGEAKASLRLEGDELRLAADVELALFRIAQELLRNAERHAHATNIAVSLIFSERSVTLEVADDGVGMAQVPDYAEMAAQGHLGLLGINERVELLDGHVSVSTGKDIGTSIRVFIPRQPGSDISR
jgi:PAS domain S-box-containing protein